MKCLLALILLLAGAYVDGYPDGFNPNICKPPPNNGGRDFPKIPNAYVARLEWNDYETRRTMYMEEFVSVENNVGAAYITGLKHPGITTKYITSADTGELFIIYDVDAQEFEDGNCVVQKLDGIGQSEFALPFKKDPKFPGTDTLLSGRSLLNLGADPVGNMMYNGTAIKNGILCDVWVGCLFVKQGKITMDVTYHFSDSSWQPAGGDSPSPISIHARGQSAEDQTFKLEQVFNYAYFSSKWPYRNNTFFEHVFQTPEHNYCPGRANIFQLPDVPQHFSFKAEIIDHISDTDLFTYEIYDFKSNYSRIDYKTPPTGNNTVDYGVSPSTVINDFGTGVSYVIDAYSRTCKAIPIISSEFDSMPVGEGSTRMKTPSEFFDFSALGQYPYQYMGEYNVRNIVANGWISYRPYPDLSSPNNATWEWYFATDRTVFKAQDVTEYKEPLRLDIKSAAANVDLSYNIFRFSEKVPDPRYFDIRPCYEKSDSLLISMQITGNWMGLAAENHLQVLGYWFQLSVDAFTGVRSIRVQDMQFEFPKPGIIAVTFTLLGPAPIQGDIANSVPQVPLKLATERLTSSFKAGIFEVYFMPNRKNVTIFYPVPDTLKIVERLQSQSVLYHQKYVNVRGITAGQAIGLAFGVFILGALLSLSGVFVYRHLTAPKGPGYTPHHNDN